MRRAVLNKHNLIIGQKEFWIIDRIMREGGSWEKGQLYVWAKNVGIRKIRQEINRLLKKGLIEEFNDKYIVTELGYEAYEEARQVLDVEIKYYLSDGSVYDGFFVATKKFKISKKIVLNLEGYLHIEYRRINWSKGMRFVKIMGKYYYVVNGNRYYVPVYHEAERVLKEKYGEEDIKVYVPNGWAPLLMVGKRFVAFVEPVEWLMGGEEVEGCSDEAPLSKVW